MSVISSPTKEKRVMTFCETNTLMIRGESGEEKYKVDKQGSRQRENGSIKRGWPGAGQRRG